MHQLPYSWGRPTSAPGVFAIGGGDWVITWSPEQIHPYAREWLRLSQRMGPAGEMAPPIDLWMYSLQTKDLND